MVRSLPDGDGWRVVAHEIDARLRQYEGAKRRYGLVMRRVPWWAVLSSLAAPVLLIGGWTLAAAVQPLPFDSVVRTISELAARDTPHRWLMTSALVGLGLSHLATAGALAPVAAAGRLTHGLGGLATLLVAAFPLPAGGRSSLAHTAAASVAFISLAVWPALWMGQRGPGQTAAAVLRPRVSAAAACALLLTVAWFFTELLVGGQRVGLAERVAAGAQAVWPLAVVLSVRRVQLGTVPVEPSQT
jgi:hypothetical membrane protein